MNSEPHLSDTSIRGQLVPFRRSVLRGLGVVLPPLLTIAIFAWLWQTVQDYVLEPCESLACSAITYCIADIHDDIPPEAEWNRRNGADRIVTSFDLDGRRYVRTPNEQWIPDEIYDEVIQNTESPIPNTGWGIYREYVRVKHLKRYRVVPAFLSLFVMSLYLLGKLMAAGIGRFLWSTFENVITQLPLVRSVYTSVKRVTDLVIKDKEANVEYRHVVAVEYPRRDCWSVGFVTGESLLAIEDAAGEPVVSLLMPTSPMPATGFTITVRKSDTIDLDITMDQALQFVLSCGVLAPVRDRQRVATGIQTALSESTELSPPSISESS